jgi:hypothetical protein
MLFFFLSFFAPEYPDVLDLMSRIAHRALRPSLGPIGEGVMSKFPSNTDRSTVVRVEASFRELMEQCWDHDPVNRPPFPVIVHSLETILESYESASVRSF